MPVIVAGGHSGACRLQTRGKYENEIITIA
jgi:hypothetical protein